MKSSPDPAELPIVCQLKALDAGQRTRQRLLLEIAHAKVQKISELDDGYELQFSSDLETVLELTEWITLERLCCGFAAFSIASHDAGSVIVRLAGPPGAREVLAAEMGIGRSLHCP